MCGKYPQQPPYTHYKSDGATRIDRIYITDTLRKRKQRAETITVPFFEHFAVAVCLTYSHQTCSCKIRLWKVNISLLEENTYRDTLMLLWSKWERLKNIIPTRRHGGIDMLSKGYDRPPSARVHRGIMTEETWKNSTMLRFTTQYDPPPREGKCLHYCPTAEAKILRLIS